MARARSSHKGLIILGVAGVGALFFWPEIQSLVAGAGKGAGAGIAQATGAGAPCSTAFIPGVQYVAKGADGKFHVIVNGRDIYSSADQGTAERYYNSAVCP